jgi:bifunctional DNA-binding transcriptional regulator/antitoxin component of YhaV-PrlF toxin-antitoxin module
VPAGGVKKEVTVSKRGSLILPKELIEELGFEVKDLFLARKTKAGILLKPTFHTFISIFERFFNVFFLDKADILICSCPRQSKGIRPHSQCR